MKRTAIVRGTVQLKQTAMKRGTKPMRSGAPMKRTTPINHRSKRRRAEYAGKGGRAQFVADTLERIPNCVIRWPGVCVDRAVDVHESILRSRGGALVPGPKAEAQGQRFYSCCRPCHDFTHAHRPASELLGFLDPRSATEISRLTARVVDNGLPNV